MDIQKLKTIFEEIRIINKNLYAYPKNNNNLSLIGGELTIVREVSDVDFNIFRPYNNTVVTIKKSDIANFNFIYDV